MCCAVFRCLCRQVQEARLCVVSLNLMLAPFCVVYPLSSTQLAMDRGWYERPSQRRGHEPDDELDEESMPHHAAGASSAAAASTGAVAIPASSHPPVRVSWQGLLPSMPV